MTGLVLLWLPILVSAVFVFLVSSVIHMLPLWHKSDYPAAPKENELLTAVGPLEIPPGDYMVPRAASSAEMQTPEFREKLEKGPVLILTVFPPGPFSMGRNLVMWFLYAVVVSVFSAYIAGRAVPPGANYLEVFRFAGATAFIGYSLTLWQMSIWYQRSWSLTLKSTVDGLIYALIVAGVFGWLWPS